MNLKMATMPETTSEYVTVCTGPHKIQKMIGKNVMPPPQTMAAQIETSERSYETLKASRRIVRKRQITGRNRSSILQKGIVQAWGHHDK